MKTTGGFFTGGFLQSVGRVNKKKMFPVKLDDLLSHDHNTGGIATCPVNRSKDMTLK